MAKSMRPQNMKLALRADSGLSVGQYYPLGQSRSILGRSVEAAIPVDDTKASRSHAAVDFQNGFYLLVDLGSTNGTFLNGTRLEVSQFLNPGDEIRIGSTVYVVELLEKARQNSTRNWREPTSIIMPEAVARAGRVNTKENFRPAWTSTALPAHAPRGRRFTEGQITYGRWVVAVASLVITAAAIALRIG